MSTRTTKSRRLGQGLIEYAMLVAMVGLLLVGAVQVLRGSMGKAFGTVTRRLEGVGHRISGHASPTGSTSTGKTSSLAVDMHSHEGHGGVFERRIVLDEQTGRMVSVEVCAVCGEVR
jgi:Flp pilus assembly pilin Flp